MLHQVQSELEEKEMETNKYKAKCEQNNQDIKLLEHEITKMKKMDKVVKEKDSHYAKLESEYQELKITKDVYMEKITELVEQVNSTQDAADQRITELEKELEKAQKMASVNNQNNAKTSTFYQRSVLL